MHAYQLVPPLEVQDELNPQPHHRDRQLPPPPNDLDPPQNHPFDNPVNRSPSISTHHDAVLFQPLVIDHI